MTCLLSLSALIGVALVAGGVWWATARKTVRKRQPARASGKLTVQYRGPLDFAGTELSDDIVVHRTEAR